MIGSMIDQMGAASSGRAGRISIASFSATGWRRAHRVTLLAECVQARIVGGDVNTATTSKFAACRRADLQVGLPRDVHNGSLRRCLSVDERLSQHGSIVISETDGER